MTPRPMSKAWVRDGVLSPTVSGAGRDRRGIFAKVAEVSELSSNGQTVTVI